MAVYSEKLLKGDELFYYTKKIQAKFAEAEGQTQEKIDELNEKKLELDIEKEVVYKTEYIYDGQAYDTEEEAEAAAQEAGDEDPEISTIKKVDQILDNDGNPVEPSKNRLYLVPASSGDEATTTEQMNVYNEFIWTENGFELVGSTDIQLEELTTSDIDDIWNEAFSA